LAVERIMVIAEATEHGSGIFLKGDMLDLQSVHSTIHDLANEATFGIKLQETLLALAYNIRKAYEGQREQVSMGFDDFGNEVVYLGVRILWPGFLIRLNLLRHAASLQPTTKKHQAHLYMLEALAEEALTEYEPRTAQRVMDWLARFAGLYDGYLTQFLEELDHRYIELEDGLARFRELPDILHMTWTLSEEYTEFERKLTEAAEEEGCSPDMLTIERDGYPEFKW